MPDHQILLGDDVAPAKHGESAHTRHLQAIARGRADMAAGRLVDLRSIDDWIEALGTALERTAPEFTI